MPEENGKQVSWFEWGGYHLRTLVTYGGFFAAVFAAAGFWLNDSRFMREAAADYTGTTLIKEDISSLRQSIDALADQIAAMNRDADTRSDVASAERQVLNTRVTRVENLLSTDLDTTPSVKYVSYKMEPLVAGQKIHIGDRVRVVVQFIKIRDCGDTEARDFVLDAQGVRAQLADVSTRDRNGAGIIVVPDPNKVLTVAYTAVIPEDKGLTPGITTSWVAVRYDERICPKASTVESMPFTFNLEAAR